MELAVLETLPWDKINIQSFLIEVTWYNLELAVLETLPWDKINIQSFLIEVKW